jgi:hypothetical protein
MSFQIEIVKVDVERKGKYSTASVSHKTADGKIDNKKVQSFTYKEVFNTLSQAQPGDLFEIESQKIKNEKDGKEYWTWTSVNSVGKAGTTSGPSMAKTVKSSYETPTERAARQVYIVRQSSISNAVAYFEAKGDTRFDPDAVIDVAKRFEAYVFSNAVSLETVLPSEVE